MARIRLDQLVVERGLAPSRERARALILAGHITVDDRPATKAGTAVDDRSAVALVTPTVASAHWARRPSSHI